MPYIWVRPQGSNRDGMTKKSLPAMILWAIAGSNPIRQANFSGRALASSSKKTCDQGSPAPRIANCTSRLEDARQDPGQQIDALLFHQARHEAEKRNGLFFGQSQNPLQVFLAEGLARKIACRITRGDHRVRLGVPLVVVRAVEDAGQIGGPPPHDTLDPVCKGRMQDLPRIGRAHGVDEGGVNHPALQEIDLVEELELAEMEVLPADPEDVHERFVEYALVEHVVNGQDARGCRQHRIVTVQSVEEHGDRGRVPVVDVNDVGPPVHVPGDLQGRPRKKREAQVIVREPVAVMAVDASPCKIRIMPDEKSPGLRSGRLALQHRDGDPAQDAHGDFEGCDGPQAERLAVDGSVAGQDDPHVVTCGGKRPGERIERIPQSPRLGEGSHLRGGHEDPRHSTFLSVGMPLFPARIDERLKP